MSKWLNLKWSLWVQLPPYLWLNSIRNSSTTLLKLPAKWLSSQLEEAALTLLLISCNREIKEVSRSHVWEALVWASQLYPRVSQFQPHFSFLTLKAAQATVQAPRRMASDSSLLFRSKLPKIYLKMKWIFPDRWKLQWKGETKGRRQISQQDWISLEGSVGRADWESWKRTIGSIRTSWSVCRRRMHSW